MQTARVRAVKSTPPTSLSMHGYVWEFHKILALLINIQIVVQIYITGDRNLYNCKTEKVALNTITEHIKFLQKGLNAITSISLLAFRNPLFSQQYSP